MNRTVDCPSHGLCRWNGEVFCETCGRLYRLPTNELDAAGLTDVELPKKPPYCDCGALLTPTPDDPKRDDFSGRPVCPECFERHKPRMLSA